MATIFVMFRFGIVSNENLYELKWKQRDGEIDIDKREDVRAENGMGYPEEEFLADVSVAFVSVEDPERRTGENYTGYHESGGEKDKQKPPPKGTDSPVELITTEIPTVLEIVETKEDANPQRKIPQEKRYADAESGHSNRDKNGQDGKSSALDEVRELKSSAPTSKGQKSVADSFANKTELIILWSIRPETDKISWWDKTKDGKAEFASCEWSDCEITRDRGRVKEARIIVFRHHDPFPEWPDIRFPNQTYIHVLNERPNPGHWWLAKFDDKINITWNYRRNADVSHHKIVVEKENPSDDYYVPQVSFANKSKSVMWAVSHCKVPSQRDVYAAELAKYIDVDIYGKCGTLTCPKDDAENCTKMWASTYKFHLSFENTICPDYITEKFYRPLKYDMIPIVLGGGDYKTVGPPHSYIDVKDYESPKELAKYLRYLAHNEKKYNEYFQWKQKYTIQDNFRRMCKMCEMAQNPEQWARPVHHDYYHWWMKECDAELMDRMRAQGNW
ncbi:hypothetical protein LSH36_1166g00060 [Paralvinella palmiformis]|uniref:Fucosyltransferase n=1 Tax=Paralvinella palmiformis TaxID=53620 RepID=A0AAD9IU89_9ANNE|nr:hypothetical protein LSH36_1166g00060 [Paralvinella palmiformis]